jgi:hypothetical protein
MVLLTAWMNGWVGESTHLLVTVNMSIGYKLVVILDSMTVK